MKAVRINKYGGNEVLEVKSDVPEPIPSKDQILVKISAASINPFDLKIASGLYKEQMPLQFPATLGGDFANEEVYGTANIFNGGSGAFAGFAAVNKDHMAPKPKSVSPIKAAALPLVGSSSIQALEEHIKLQKGQKILILGGAGGIGHIAIQLAKTLGAYVATTTREENMNFVKTLGANEVIDYEKQNFEEVLKDYDAVYDTVGGNSTERAFLVLKKGGVLVSMLGDPDPGLAEKYDVKAIGQFTHINTEHLKRLAELVDSGKIKVHVDAILPLEKIAEAFKLQESHPRGKIVLNCL